MSNAKASAWQILVSLIATALLMMLVPAIALADGGDDPAGKGLASESVAGPLAGPGYENDARSASADSSAEGFALAPMFAGPIASIVSADVALDAADPVVGSFTVDGLTYAVGPDGLTLVAVDSAAMLDGAIAIPASVTFNDVTYPVTAVGPYAFYLSGATDVALPASIASVDGRAFRSSDAERIEVDPANPNFASFDGCLYDSQLLRLLLIPEGRKGSVLLSCETEVVEPSLFSHCSLVEAISVEEGGAAFSSWEGLLYDASGTTLLRVPAGATDITIHDGCTTIAAGALEGCAKLERINAPASVTSISPDVFASVPTVSLPATSVSGSSTGAEGEAEVSPRRVVASSQGLEAPLALPDLGSTSASPSAEASGSIPQLTTMVALSTIDDDLPCIDPSVIAVNLPEDAEGTLWSSFGFKTTAQLDAASTYAATSYPYWFVVDARGGTLWEASWYRSGSNAASACWWERHQLSSQTKSMGVFWWEVYGKDATSSRLDCAAMQVDSNKYGNFYIYDATRTGYAFCGFNTNANASWSLPTNWAHYSNVTLYALWKPNTYAVAFNLNGASGTAPSNIAATYDQNLTLPEATRAGYLFLGWDTRADGAGTRYQPGAVRNLTATDKATVTLYAQWTPAISVDVPLEVTARIDKLGLEGQTPASGYIESRCGEPLKVTDAAFEPLSGAATLFGADAASVSLEAFTDATASPLFRFPLSSAGAESDSAALAPLSMASYGTRIPVRYRFDMPDDLLPTLAESTLPVCQVSYTVALA